MVELIVPSRSSVDKAGRILRDPDLSIEDFNFALDTLSQWRSLHTYPINALNNLIRRITRDAYPGAIIAQRLKRFASIVDKLVRYQNMSLARMHDIGGLRVVLRSIDDVNNFHATIISDISHGVISPPDDYITRPKPDGYRSLHQVFKYKSRKHPELDGLRVEVQIRSKLQHAWATAVETLGVVTGSSLKTGHGSDDAKKYFRLASALFSLDEDSPVIDEYREVPPGEVVRQLTLLDDMMQFSGKLKGIANSIKAIESQNKKSAYQMLELDTKKNKANILGFRRNQLEYAEELYKDREQATRNNPDISVVLVGPGELQAIKAAYPNYFLDANLFLDNLERICNRYR